MSEILSQTQEQDLAAVVAAAPNLGALATEGFSPLSEKVGSVDALTLGPAGGTDYDEDSRYNIPKATAQGGYDAQLSPLEA